MKPDRPLLALLALALLLAPPTVAAEGRAEFPADFVALSDRWIDEAEAEGAPYADREWYAEAQRFLDLAREAQAAGNIRVVMYDLETYLELVRGYALHDEAMELGSDAERRTFIVERAREWADEADAAWVGFRGELHAYDGELRSVRSLERAAYAADLAVTARVARDDFDKVAREIPRVSGFNATLSVGLANAAGTPALNLGWARDLLDTLPAVEGLPPRMNESAWSLVSEMVLSPTSKEDTAPPLLPYHPTKEAAIANNETLLGFGVLANELRASRASSIYLIFGDGKSRGLDVTGDATRNMGRRLDNATMETPRSFGLEGLFTADAMATAAYTLELAEETPPDLGLVIASWSRLDIANILEGYLATASPVRPASTETETKGTPAPAALVVVAAVAFLALARRRAA